MGRNRRYYKCGGFSYRKRDHREIERQKQELEGEKKE